MQPSELHQVEEELPVAALLQPTTALQLDPITAVKPSCLSVDAETESEIVCSQNAGEAVVVAHGVLGGGRSDTPTEAMTRNLNTPNGVKRVRSDGLSEFKSEQLPGVCLPLLVQPYVGNVLRGKHISESEAVAHSQKANLKRNARANGLVFNESFPGFDPLSWNHVVRAPLSGTEASSYRFELERPTRDAGQSETVFDVVDICYRPQSSLPSCVRAHSEACIDAHSNVRKGDAASGDMVGVGVNQAYSGFRDHFKHDPSKHMSICNGMYVAGQVFAAHFRERNVGWDEMMESQRLLWPARESERYPQSWFHSRNLGNASHIDCLDGARSFAVWHSNSLQTESHPSWWFLFPAHGLAIEIVDCTWVSWDGRFSPHCTAVPHNLCPGENLYSFMCSLRQAVCASLVKRQQVQVQLQSRSEACDILSPVCFMEKLSSLILRFQGGSQQVNLSEEDWVDCGLGHQGQGQSA